MPQEPTEREAQDAAHLGRRRRDIERDFSPDEPSGLEAGADRNAGRSEPALEPGRSGTGAAAPTDLARDATETPTGSPHQNRGDAGPLEHSSAGS